MGAIEPPGIARRARGPSPAKTAATRSALVAAGLAVFLENGFSGTRMHDVAARAGVAKGTTYRHFADKAALFAEVLRVFVREAAGGRPIGRPRPSESTEAFLRRTLVPILRGLQAEDRFKVLNLVISEGARFPELADIYQSVAIAPVLRFAQILAARAERRGELRAEVLSGLPLLLAAPVIVSAIWNNVFAGNVPLDVAAVFERHLDLIFGVGDR